MSTSVQLQPIEAAKRLAAYAAVDRHVKPEHKVRRMGHTTDNLVYKLRTNVCIFACQVIGIGSGSTVPYVVERIMAQGAEANRGRKFIPTGESIFHCVCVCTLMCIS